jgi:hypothetical protein
VKPIGVLFIAGIVAAGAAEAADAPRLTITARPTIASPTTQVSLSGVLSTRRAGEFVSVEQKECGATGYRAVAGGQTTNGGFWAAQIPFVPSTSSLRARWKNVVSAPVVVRSRPSIRLERLPSRTAVRVKVGTGALGAGVPLRGRYVELQRRSADGRWARVARARLKISEFNGLFEVDFPLKRRGLLVRAYLSRASAAPCFLPGASALIRS